MGGEFDWLKADRCGAVTAEAHLSELRRKCSVRATDHRLTAIDPLAQQIWDLVARSPLHSMWDFQGVSAKLVWTRTFRAILGDDLLSRAAEMGYYFLFALFPTLVSASSILGLAARQASHIYDKLLHYLALVVPGGAYAMVIETFNQTAAHATTGKDHDWAGGRNLVGIGGVRGDPGWDEYGV